MDKVTPWHSLPIEKVLQDTGSSPDRLTTDAVQKKQARFGKNELKAKKKITDFVTFFFVLRSYIAVFTADPLRRCDTSTPNSTR